MSERTTPEALRALASWPGDPDEWEAETVGALRAAADTIEDRDRTIEALEAERDDLAGQVERFQVGEAYEVGHEHGSLVAKRYRDERDEALALLREVGEYADTFDHWTDPLPDGFTVATVKLVDLRRCRALAQHQEANDES